MRFLLLSLPIGICACYTTSATGGTPTTEGLSGGTGSSDVSGTGTGTGAGTSDGSGSSSDTGDSDPTPIAPGCDGIPVLENPPRLPGAPWAPPCYRSPAGESVEMVDDADLNTKFVAWANSMAIRHDAGAPHIVTRYAITSANDAPERDPVRWVLYGSHDGKMWTAIDTRNDQDFPQRFERREYTFENCHAYRHYLIRMENEAGPYSQIAELELYGTPAYDEGQEDAAPEAASALAATAISRRQVDLHWQDNAEHERFFRIEQSSDGQTFTTVGYTRPDETRFSVFELDGGTEYFFRVVAENSVGDAAASNVASVTTPAPHVGTAQPDGSTRYTENGYSVTVLDLAGDLPDWWIPGIVEEFFLTYPRMAADYHPEAATDVRIEFDPAYTGAAAAYTAQARIVVSPDWAKTQFPEGVHVIVHEGFHIVQNYGSGWLVEGFADLAAYDYMTSKPITCWTLQRYTPTQTFTDGYGVVARFLIWLRKTSGEQLIFDIDDALRNGVGMTEVWPMLTGKTIDELWAEYAASDHVPLSHEWPRP